MPTLPQPAWAGPRGGGRRAGQSLGWEERGRARGSDRQLSRRRVGGCGAPGRREGGTQGRGAEDSRGGWRGCGRARVRVCALRLPAPRPPGRLPSSCPRPARPPSPRNQCSCCRAGCGFLQSLPRPPLRSERARSPRSSAHRSRPVSPDPSRGQPPPRPPRGVASRPTRPAAEEREEDGTPAPPPPILGR